MSVIIKGMEMPKGCVDCPMFDWDLQYLECKANNKFFLPKGECRTKRESTCPLIEVPADVQPVKHGKWEVGDISYRYPSGVHYCSVCDYIDPFSTGSMHYCPNCGAKMDGKDDV